MRTSKILCSLFVFINSLFCIIRTATAISQREKKELVAAVTSYALTLAEYETRDRAGRLPFV
jgi:hypothetical protein